MSWCLIQSDLSKGCAIAILVGWCQNNALLLVPPLSLFLVVVQNGVMMTRKPFFQLLAARERTLCVNHALARLLDGALAEIPELHHLPRLQKNYLVAETSYAYQHFGFSVFGPSARVFLSDQMSICSGVAVESIRTWMELLAYTLLEDFNVLKVVTGEPDWGAVDAAFFGDFSRRVLCSDLGEKSELGLDTWAESFVDDLCGRAAAWLMRLQTEPLSLVLPDVRKSLADRPFSEHLVQAMTESLEEVSKSTLQILVWRIQFFTSFADIRQEAKFFVRADSEESQICALRVAALLSLLLPHLSGDGSVLLPPSPLTLSQMSAVLKDEYSSHVFETNLFRNWLALEGKNLAAELAPLASRALEAGLIFEVPATKKSKAYGLSLAGMRILSPFRQAITEALLKTPPVQLAAQVVAQAAST